MTIHINPYGDPRDSVDPMNAARSMRTLRSKVSKPTQMKVLDWPARNVCLPPKPPLISVDAYSIMEGSLFCPAVNIPGLSHTIAPISEINIVISHTPLYQICAEGDIVELTGDSVLLTAYGPDTVERIVRAKELVAFVKFGGHYYGDTKLSIEYKPIVTVKQGIGTVTVSMSAWDAYNELDDDFALVTNRGMLIL